MECLRRHRSGAPVQTCEGQSARCCRWLPRWAWQTRLKQRWWRFSLQHRRAILRANCVILALLLLLEVYLVMLLVQAWQCFGPHAVVRCSVGSFGRLHQIDGPRKLQFSKKQPTPRLLITSAEVYRARVQEAGKESDAPTAVAVRGRGYGAVKLSEFSCVFYCSEASAAEGDGGNRSQTACAPRSTGSEPDAAKRTRRAVAVEVKWSASGHAFGLLCPLPANDTGLAFVPSSNTMRDAAAVAATDDPMSSSSRPSAIVAVQVEARGDGAALISQRYALIEPVPLAAVADARAVGEMQPHAATASTNQLLPPLAGCRGCAPRRGRDAVACAWQDYTAPFPIGHVDFVEWMEWLLLLGFNRVLVFDNGELDSVAPARDYYVDRSKLDVMQMPNALLSNETKSFAAKTAEEKVHEEDEETKEWGRIADYSSLPTKQWLDKRATASAVHCLEKLGRHYKYVAVLRLGEVVVPFEEASLVTLLDKLVTPTSNATASSLVATRDAAFYFEGATYYTTFQDSRLGTADSSLAGRVLNYGRRTRLEPRRGCQIYRAASLNHGTSAVRWLRSFLRRASSGGGTAADALVSHVSSLLAWTHGFGYDCFTSESFDSPSCLEVFQDDPHWLSRFATTIIQSTKRVQSELQQAESRWQQPLAATSPRHATQKRQAVTRSLAPLKNAHLEWTSS